MKRTFDAQLLLALRRKGYDRGYRGNDFRNKKIERGKGLFHKALDRYFLPAPKRRCTTARFFHMKEWETSSVQLRSKKGKARQVALECARGLGFSMEKQSEGRREGSVVATGVRNGLDLNRTPLLSSLCKQWSPLITIGAIANRERGASNHGRRDGLTMPMKVGAILVSHPRRRTHQRGLSGELIIMRPLQLRP